MLAVVADGNSISLYINTQLIQTIHDTSYSQGQIGILTADTVTPSDIEASDARVWTL